MSIRCMKIRDLEAGLLLSLALIAPGAPALSTDGEQPISIEADSAEADDVDKITIYRGDVVIQQGTLQITGDTVTIYYDEQDDLSKMVALGDPATFHQLPDGEADEPDNYQRARASRMEYYADSDQIVLLGKAVYAESGNTVQAERIVYDSRTSRMQADGQAAAAAEGAESSRIRVTIDPSKGRK